MLCQFKARNTLSDTFIHRDATGQLAPLSQHIAFLFCGWNKDIYFPISWFVFHVLRKSQEKKYFIMMLKLPRCQNHTGTSSMKDSGTVAWMDFHRIMNVKDAGLFFLLLILNVPEKPQRCGIRWAGVFLLLWWICSCKTA